MAPFFERALMPLAQLGILDILVFVLVFIIIYIILHKSQVLGQRATKNMQIIVALSTALMFINIIPGTVFLSYLVWFIVAFVAIIMLILIMSLLGIEEVPTKYAILGVLGLIFVLVFSQMVKSALVMSLVLSIAVLGFVVCALLLLPPYALLVAAGGNLVLAIMALTLDFQTAVEDVYTSGITIGLSVFAFFLWYMLRGGEVAVSEQREERRTNGAAQNRNGTTRNGGGGTRDQNRAATTAPAAPQRSIRDAAPPVPARQFSREGNLQRTGRWSADELDQFLENNADEEYDMSRDEL